MKDIAHPTSHCQYSLTSQASLDVLEKYVLVYQAAELDEMNGRTWTVYSDPKETEASTIKALQFLAGSHLAWKPLDSTMQKEKQTETVALRYVPSLLTLQAVCLEELGLRRSLCTGGSTRL